MGSTGEKEKEVTPGTWTVQKRGLVPLPSLALSASLSLSYQLYETGLFLDADAMPSELPCTYSGGPAPGEIIQHHLSGVREYLNKLAYKPFRFFGRMDGLLFSIKFSNTVIQHGFHIRLPKKIECFRSLEIAAVIHNPYSNLVARTESILFVARERITFVEYNRLAKSEELAALQLIPNPSCIPV